jgi:pimeloyl-ACP methyl ester carboxylesterase
MQSIATSSDRLYREDRGRGAPLLLVHGTGGDGAGFDGAAELLQRKRRVITYDRRGFSRSAGEPYGRRDYHRRHADDAARLLDELGIEKASVCGWSGGGLVALSLALHHPSRVNALVLYEPPFQAARSFSLRPLFGFAKVLGLRAIGKKEAAAAAFFRVALGADYDKLPSERKQRMVANADALLCELDGGTLDDLTAEKLAPLACPLTVMVGSQSSPFLFACADRLSRLMPRATLIRVPGAGHGMPALQPLAFADLLDRALPPG